MDEEGCMMKKQWYKDMVFYHIWPRSFKDGNHDGIGDLYGIIEKLDYIQDLGCDGIWLSPIYPSPGKDCGYDVMDYMNIDEIYGGMEVFDQLVCEVHKRQMKIIMDLVVNHTSTSHEWFEKSRRRIEPYSDYYIWQKGKKHQPPNNWKSNFEGSAWQYDSLRHEYYLHLFAIEQADLNMANPLVRQEVKHIMRFWLDKGVDGFREDVITYISKKYGLPNDYLYPIYKGMRFYNHGPYVHDYLKEFKEDVLDHYDCVTLAEAPLVTPQKALEYIDEQKGQIDMMIQFESQCADCLFTDWLPTPFSLRRLKHAFSKWQKQLDGKAWNVLYLENHDHPRVLSRYGNELYRESAKTLAVSYLFLKGTPFIYQGQEIGMTNFRPEDPFCYEDVHTINQYERMKDKKSLDQCLKRLWRSSRDSARTPMQWDDSMYAGFSDVKPWFCVNDNYKTINVEQQKKDSYSILSFYKEMIHLRKSLQVVKEGNYKEYFPYHKYLYVYSRQTTNQKILVICSFKSQTQKMKIPTGFDLTKAKLIVRTHQEYLPDVLLPYESRVYLWEK